MDFGIASVAAITVICYLVGLTVKATPITLSFPWYAGL